MAHRATTAYLVNQDVVAGSTQGSLTYLFPQSNLTRAQAAALIIRTREHWPRRSSEKIRRLPPMWSPSPRVRRTTLTS